jgi:hypothetical protein
MAAPPDQPAQRQSCDRCHTQKLRCTHKSSSNGSVCDRCFRKRAQCVYSSSLPKGRPKRTGTGGDPVSSSSTAPVAVPASSSSTSSSLSATVQDGSCGKSTAHTPPPAETSLTLGDDLELMFDECFVRKNPSRSDVYQDSIVSFQRRAERSSRGIGPGLSPHGHLSHESVLSFLTMDMVEMMLKRYGCLGCQQPDNAADRNYSACLLADRTPTMFDSPSDSYPETLASPGRHCIIQLIDLWFSVHHFSPVVSKSLLIAQYDDGTVDEALLAIILADACQAFHSTVVPDEDGIDKAEILYRFAAAQLKSRPLSLVDPGSLSISTAQTMVLMAWRELRVGRIRRATCLAGYTCRIVRRLNESRRKEGRKNCATLSGVDIGIVETEILQNIEWLCWAASTWAFIQIDQPFPLLSPEEMPDLPCLDEVTSAMIRLDRATNNISTLPAQIQAMQRLFPLSHITSTVAHIYTLYLNAPVDGTKIEAAPWQTRHIYRLYRLRHPYYDPTALSSEIRAILSMATHAVEIEVTNVTSQSLLLFTYHTIAIHMLFPKSKTDALPESQPILPSTLHAFCQAASAVIAVSRRLLSLSTGLLSAQTLGWADAASMLALSLDTCSRALDHIYSNFEQRPLPERQGTLAIREQLAGYTRELHQISREVLASYTGSVARLAKKRLKRMKLAFESLGSSPAPQSSQHYPDDRTSNHSVFSNVDRSGAELLLDPPFGLDQSVTIQFNSTPSTCQPNMIPFGSASVLEAFDMSLFADKPAIGSLLGLSKFSQDQYTIRPEPAQESAEHDWY